MFQFNVLWLAADQDGFPCSSLTVSWHNFLLFGFFPVDDMLGLLYMYSNAILCITSSDGLSVFGQSDFEGSLGFSHAVATGDLVYYSFLLLLCSQCFQLDQ